MMNKNQKKLTICCILAVFLTLCFVPCEYNAKVPPSDKNYVKFNHYAEDKTMPIWDIKSIYSVYSTEGTRHYNLVKRNYHVLFVEWGALLIAYIGLFFVINVLYYYIQILICALLVAKKH